MAEQRRTARYTARRRTDRLQVVHGPHHPGRAVVERRRGPMRIVAGIEIARVHGPQRIGREAAHGVVDDVRDGIASALLVPRDGLQGFVAGGVVQHGRTSRCCRGRT